MSDKNFKVKSGLQVPSLTTAGPVVTDNSGNVTSSATLPISQGGTGQTTAGNALNALLPLQTSQDNKYLQTNGINTQWTTVLQPVYSDNAPATPQVGQVWIESDSSSDSFDPNIIRRKTTTATAGQTSFSTDVAFIQGYEQVYFNGMLLLRTTDYTTPTDTSVVLAAAAAAGDIVEILSITNLNSINAATTTTNTFTGNQIIQANLGIGGTPTNLFTVFGSSAGQIIGNFANSNAGVNTVALRSGATGGNWANSLALQNFTGTTTYGEIRASADGQLGLFANGTERIRIDASGRIGIGTSSPLYQVHQAFASGTDVNTSNYWDWTGAGGSQIQMVRNSTANSQTVRTFRIRGGNDFDSFTSFELGMESNHDLRFITNNTERMRIKSDGTVLVGTSQVYGAALTIEKFGSDFYPGLKYAFPAGKIFLSMQSAAASDNWFGFMPQYNNSTGSSNLWLATNNLNFTHQSGHYIGSEADNNVTSHLSFGRVMGGSGGDVYASKNEQMRLTTDGYFLIGYTSSNGAYRLQVNSQIFATSSTIATSDGRYKENVNTINSGLNIIDALRPVSFTWKEHAVHNFPEGKTVGFIAQEVQEALADYDWVDNLIKTNVNEETEEEFLGIAEGNLIPLLVAAVKELKSRVETLEAANV